MTSSNRKKGIIGSVFNAMFEVLLEFANMAMWLVHLVIKATFGIFKISYAIGKGGLIGISWIVKTMVLGFLSLCFGAVSVVKHLVRLLARGVDGIKELAVLIDPWARTYWT